jgi:hypothetical protein
VVHTSYDIEYQIAFTRISSRSRHARSGSEKFRHIILNSKRAPYYMFNRIKCVRISLSFACAFYDRPILITDFLNRSRAPVSIPNNIMSVIDTVAKRN